ncbi:MAG: tetratricopeptide repeat protein [Euryarchaeota archaeon]|nr:tetratricopeptide repeat protein [Euryarchaeota archaeon]
MILDSLLNKEIRLLKKVEKLFQKGEKLLRADPAQAASYIGEALKEIARNHQIIKEKKREFSAILGKIGNAFTILNNYKDADAAFKLAFSYDSGNSSAYIYYARSLAKRKDFVRAHDMVNKAININRKDKVAWETKAEIYEMQGDVDEALKIYRNLIAMYPDELKYYNNYLKHKPRDEEILFKKGILLYKNGNYADAARTLEDVVEISPSSKESFLYLGATYEKLERYSDAIYAFKRVISIDPEDKHGWLNLAVIYKKIGEYRDSLKAIKEAIKLEPNNAKAWEIRAEVEYYLEDYESALNSINQALDIESTKNALNLKREILKKHYIPEEMIKTCSALINEGSREIEIYLDLAKGYYDVKNYEQALQVLDLILKTSPHHLPTLILMKNTLKAMKRWEKVIDVCTKILEIDPKNVETMLDMANAYTELGKHESALHFLKKATETDPKNVELWIKRKEAAKKLNKPGEIVDACIGVISITEDFDTYVDLAKAYYTMGRFAEAKKVLTKALRLKEDAVAWNQYGMVNYKLKDFENAKLAFEKATSLKPDVKSYWSNLGWILEKLQKYQEAVEAIDRALELDDKDMRLWYQKGICLKKLGENEQALACFDKALELNPEFSKALLERGNILLEMGHLDDAKESYEKLLKLNPGMHEAIFNLALIYFKKKEYESCMKHIEDALKYSKKEEYLELKKECCKAMKNYDCVIEVCTEILSINGRNLAAYRDLAQAYLAVGKIESAINTYRKGIEIFPENESLMYELKDLLKSQNRHMDVVDIGKKILEIAPEDFQTLMDIGCAYMETEHYDEAEDYLLRALNIKKTKKIYDTLGDLYMKMKDYKSALKYYADSLKIEEDPEIYYKMAKAHYRLGELDFALKAVRKAIRKKKEAKYYLLGALIYSEMDKTSNAIKYAQKALNLQDTPEVRVLLGRILINTGEYVEAISILKVPAKEGNLRAMELLGEALEKEKRLDDALEIYRKILKEDRNNLSAYIGLGRINTALEKYEEARDAYEMAYRLNPHSREICENLSFIYEKLGDIKTALKYVDNAIEIEPENKFLWTRKGQLLMRLERYDDAKRAFEKALSIDGDFKPAMEGLKDAERYIEERDIEKYARDVLILEYNTKKRVTKKTAFKKLNIPLTILPKVFDYIRRSEPLNVNELSEEDKLKFEKATYSIAKKLNKIENIKLSEIVGVTNMKVSSAKRLLKYIETCLKAGSGGEVTPEDENLVRRAVDMDIKPGLLNLMLSLDIGICQAKRVQALLKQLEEEETGEEEYEAPEEETEQPGDEKDIDEEEFPEDDEEPEEEPARSNEEEGMFL